MIFLEPLLRAFSPDRHIDAAPIYYSYVALQTLENPYRALQAMAFAFASQPS
jgi:hypothetical protein